MTGSAPRLHKLFKPGSIALVGATERSVWSNATYENLRRYKFPGKIHLINPKGGVIYGEAAATSCAAVGEPIDLALLMVPERALLASLDDLAAAGISSAVVLSSGFAEMGAEGAERQTALAERAQALGIALLGPNCLGYVNFADGIPVWTNPRRRQREAGSMAIVSQSGSVAGSMAEFAYRQAIPLSYMVSTGNEADVDVAAVIDFLADEPNTRAIALFIETVRDVKRFSQAAWKAQRAGKRIVVLKIGSSAVSAKAAQAHTGALTGDDKVFDAACRRLGMVRVKSLEELILTADLLARMGPIGGRRLGFAALSGGMGELAADRAEVIGLEMASLSETTIAAISEALPAFGTPHNPLDLTGAAMLDVSIIERGVGLLAADPAFDVVVCLLEAPASEKEHPFAVQAMDAAGRGFAHGGKPAVAFSHLSNAVFPTGRAAEQQAGLVYSGAGLDAGLEALAGAITWWEYDRRLAARELPAIPGTSHGERPESERGVLDYLATFGVPVISAEIVGSAAAAASAAVTANGPVVLKIASPDIPHKSEAGGVALDVQPADAAARYDRMIAEVSRAQPDATIDGVIVSPMRAKGVELIVGTMRDPAWGPVIAVGLGGILVEAVKDSALRLLPVTRADALEMLDELRGQALLDGFRGMPPVDREAMADAVVRIGDAALALGPDLVSLEVNPMLALAGSVEALDGLAVWSTDSGSA